MTTPPPPPGFTLVPAAPRAAATPPPPPGFSVVEEAAAPQMTKDNHIRFAADTINQIEATQNRRLNAAAKQMVVDEFRVKAGLDPLLGKDHYAEAVRKRNENPLLAFSAEGTKGLANFGLGVAGLVAPERAGRAQRGIAAGVGEGEGAAGFAGKLAAGAITAIPAVLNPALGAAAFGASGAGSTRIDVAAMRAQGTDIGLGAELGTAAAVGLVEGLSGFITGKIGVSGGKALTAVMPQFRQAVATGGGRAGAAVLLPAITKLLTNAGVEGAEEAATQLVTNTLRKIGIDATQGITEGVVEAGMMGAAISPFLGGVAGAIQASPTAGRGQRQLASAAAKRKTPPPPTETPTQQIKRLEAELAAEQRLSRTDPLTKLFNPRGFEEMETAAFAEANETGEHIGVVETDLANFKVVNDRLGHEVGDRILVAEAEAIQEAIREETPDRPGDFSAGVAGRVGGDEFPVRLRNVDDEAKADIVMRRANEILRGKLQDIIGDQLPPQAWPFIAWGTEIRNPIEQRSSKDLKVAAEQKVIPRKDQMKKELGIPTTREGLAQFLEGFDAERAKQAKEVADEVAETPPVFTPDQVIESIRNQDEPDAGDLRPSLGDEPYVLVDVPTGLLTPSPAELDSDVLAAAERGIEEGTPPPPITLGPDGMTVDGVVRAEAAARRGVPTMAAFMPQSLAADLGLAPAPPAPPRKPQRTAAAKAKVREDRSVLGLTRLSGPARRSWQEALDSARAQKIPARAHRIAVDVETNPRVLTDIETAGVVIRAAELKNEHADLTKQITKAGEAGAEADLQFATAELNRVEAEFDTLTRALNTSGTEAGRALTARRLTIDQDFSLVAVLARARAARGKPLTTPQQKRFRDLVDQIAEKEKRIDELEVFQRTAVDKTPKAKKEATKELARLVYQRDQLQRRIRQAIENLKPRSALARIADSLNGLRVIMTSFDFSAVRRQGGFIFLSNPHIAVKSVLPMFKAFGSGIQSKKVADEIEARPNAPLYARAKLYIAPLDGTLAAREEAYASTWAEKIPGIAGSQRAYVTFLNKLRADTFDAMVASLGKNGEVTESEARAIAHFINAATGRGSLGSFEKGATALNTIFFAPRYVTSRFQLILGSPFYSKGSTWRTRKLIGQQYAKYLIGQGIYYGMVSLAIRAFLDDEEEKDMGIETDSRSSDFGKIRIGNTRLDPLSGLSQTAVILRKLWSGEKKSITTGEIAKLRGEGKKFGAGVLSEAGRFVRSKFAPIFGTAADILNGENVIGEEVEVKTVEGAGKVLVGFFPLSLGEIKSAIQEHGIPGGSALGLAALFGEGLQVHDGNLTRGSARTIALQYARQGDWESARVAVENWNATLAQRRLEDPEAVKDQKPIDFRGIRTSLRGERRKEAKKAVGAE